MLRLALSSSFCLVFMFLSMEECQSQQSISLEDARILQLPRSGRIREQLTFKRDNPFKQHESMSKFAFDRVEDLDEAEDEHDFETISEHAFSPFHRNSIDHRDHEEDEDRPNGLNSQGNREGEDFASFHTLDRQDPFQDFRRDEYQRPAVSKYPGKGLRKKRKGIRRRQEAENNSATRHHHKYEQPDETPTLHEDQEDGEGGYWNEDSLRKLDNFEKKIPSSVKNMLKSSGRKVLKSMLQKKSSVFAKQDSEAGSNGGIDSDPNGGGIMRTIMNNLSPAFAPKHVTTHVIANWVNVFAITLVWIGVGSMVKGSLITGRQIDPPFWEEFLPDKDEVAMALRELAQVADKWDHDEL